jgi:hypothetical protein
MTKEQNTEMLAAHIANRLEITISKLTEIWMKDNFIALNDIDVGEAQVRAVEKLGIIVKR